MGRHVRLLALAMLAACGNVKPSGQPDAPSAEMFTLTVSRSGNSTGSVSSTPAGITCGSTCSMQVAAGTQVTLTATPDANAAFGGWTGGGCSGSGPCVVTVNANTMIDAAFTKQQFTVTVTPNGDGTGHVTSVPAGVDCGTTCSSKFDVGATVTLTAVADAGATFAGWTGGGCSGTGDCVITLSADTTVQATFARNNSLTVTLGGNGDGSVASGDGNINCGTNCSYVYPPNTTVVLTATPKTGSDFTGWSGAGCSGTGTCTVTITTAAMVTATFTLKQFTLTVSKTGNGAGTVASTDATINCGTACTATRNYGDVVTLNASPSVGTTFAGWSGGGCSGTGACIVTISAATTVSANFTLNQYTLTAALAGTGSGNVKSTDAKINCPGTCAANYLFGQTVTLNATPSTGSSFTGWSGGGCSGTGSCVVTIAAATTVTATFTINTYTLTVTKTGAGAAAGTVSGGPINCGGVCTATINYGTTVTLTASPGASSSFLGWTGACSGTSTCSITMTSNASVAAALTGASVTYNVNGTAQTGTPQSFSVPANTTLVRIEGGGARGCPSTLLSPFGARMSGTFTVAGGQVLSIRVGQQPMSYGGGGGTYVVDGGTLYLVAGGGGCDAVAGDIIQSELEGRVVTSGGTAGTIGRADNGNGGNTLPGSNSGGGGGWFGDGLGTGAGKGYPNGSIGGTGESGVFGGYGGGGARTGLYGEGAGGGFSGGSCGDDPANSKWHGCGGGGSYNVGTAQSNTPGAINGDGYVIITY